MIEITEQQWRMLMVLGIGAVIILVAMFVYCVRCARLAYLGERWVMAAGSHRRAARALQDFDLETDALVVEHAHRWPEGVLVRMDRENVEALIRRYAPPTGQQFGGPGL